MHGQCIISPSLIIPHILKKQAFKSKYFKIIEYTYKILKLQARTHASRAPSEWPPELVQTALPPDCN